MWVKSLADADPTAGGKAANLARLIAAGLPVPEGFVVAPGVRDLRVAIPQAIRIEVELRAAALGPAIARSSATIEDGERGAAAGVFASVMVDDDGDVWAAIRGVWESALAPLAVGYAHGRPIALGVVVQRRITGTPITIYTRPPEDETADAVWIQDRDELAKYARASSDPRVALALRAETAIAARGGADVELVDDGEVLWIVQARPIVRRDPRARAAPPPAILAPLVADGRVWRWDASHNPAPLSPAQTGLVARVERAGIAPWAMRVCGGFLYTTPRGAPPVVTAARDVAALIARVEAIELRLAATLDMPTSLDDAIVRYVAHYAIWANELAPLVAVAMRAHDPARLAAVRPSRIRALLEAGDAAALADLSPVWDVAVPTYGETPHVLRDAMTRAGALAKSIPPSQPSATELERVTADLAERDDAWFYRAQAMVRRALIARADELAIDREDIAWLDLELIADHALDPDHARRCAAAARAAHTRALAWAMPLQVPAGDSPQPKLVGRGIGPPVTGRVVRFDAAMTVISRDVVVCQTVTPALAVLVIGCAALVSESVHDGLLDHGVALARELGITCVVGCHDAWSRLASGMIVTVDGSSGSVTIHDVEDKFA